MKKRALSWLLAVVMVVSLAPQTIPWAKAADSTNSSGKTDAFGLPTEVDPSQQNTDLRSNPYGTKGWVPLFQNHELVVAGVHDDEFQTTYHGATKSNGEQISSFRWSNSTNVGNAKRIATVAFDPNGTGRDEYIANLVFDASAQELRLYVTNKDCKVSDVVRFGENSKFIKELKFYQTRSMLCLTAGDFDGDGKDTLMVYVPGNNESPDRVDSIKEYKLEGSNLSYTNRKINLGEVLDGGKEALKAMLYHDGNGSNELRAHLSVDMEAGDVDLDGVEELAMTVNVNDLKNKSYDGYTELEKSYLTVYDGDKGWTQKMKRTLLNSSDGAQGRARFAGVTIGNFSDPPSDGVAPEVIAVGYYDNNSDFKGCSLNTGKLLLYSYQYQPGKTEAESKWNANYKAQELSANGFTGTGTKGDDNQNPVAVAAVSADGAMTQEYLFVSGSMYQASKTDGSRLTIVDGSGMDKNRGIGGYIINNTGILDYAVGNFDGNKQGREQVYYVEYHKQESFHKEFLCIGQLYKTGSTTTNADGEIIHTASGTFSRWTDDWTYYGKKNCNVAITAADVNNDAVLAKIKEISYGYTDPKVMAILEASPHFSELDSFGNSATSFGQKVGDQTGVSASGSFGFDIMAGFEYVAPIIETGGGIELNTSHTFTVGGGTTNTKEVEIKYANDNAEKNSVVMYATPMAYYLYDVKYPEGTQPKKESTMMLSVAMKPVTSIVSVDTYNEAAAAYADMDQIGANVQLGTPGQPNTYRAGLPNAGDKHSWRYGEPKQYYGTGTITESVTKSTDTKVSFEYEYEGSVQAYGIAGGFKVGGGYHWGVSAGTEKVSTEGLTKEGAVNCQNNPHYNFNWEFATWTVKLNGEDVPVLGYLVSNVVAPPSPAENLRLSEQTTDSMVLSWDSGARPAEYYKIYRYIEGRKNPFVFVDTVDASEAASGSYEYTLTGLAANAEYKYAITSGYYTGNNESVESEIAIGKTLASDMERLHISGPGNVTAPLGQQASFSVTVSGPATYRDFAYQWQMRQPGKKWEDIEDATQKNYTVSEVTSDLNGTMFRCMVEGKTSSSEPIPFYSDAAMLTVGMPTADAALTVKGCTEGSGKKNDPYIGQSDYNTLTTTTETGKTTKAYTVTKDGVTLTVYQVSDTNNYIGVGEVIKEDKTVSTVYYEVTKNDDTFTAGAKLDEETNYTWKKTDGTVVSPPDGTTPDNVLTKEVGDTTYMLAVVLDDQKQPTECLYVDGELYDRSGNKKPDAEQKKTAYLVHGQQQDNQYILSLTNTTTSGSDSTAEEEMATIYYELTKTTTSTSEGNGNETTTYNLAQLSVSSVNNIGSYENPNLSLYTTEVETSRNVVTSTAGAGTALSLTTTTKNISNKDEPLSVDYTLTITNTSTGTVSTLTGRTDASGTDTKQWRAPIAGLYAITTTTVGGTASAPQYYLAGVQTEQENAESTTETVYTLDSEISGEYGSTVALTTRQQTIKKTGDTISAEKSSVVDGVTYKYRLSSSAATETKINDASFDAPKAGTYVVSAYQTSTDNPSKQIKIASTTINVKRKPITLSVKLPSDEGGTQSYHAPANKSDIKFTGKDELKTGDTLLDGDILINCDLYDSNGDKRDTSGRFEITLSLNNGDNASDATKQRIADLLEKYEFTFVSRKVISEQQTGTVAYSAGAGGTVVARKGAGGSTFASNAPVPYGAEVTFDAYPTAGHMVKEWLVNGEAVTPDATGNYVLSDETVDGVTIKNKRLTVKSFSRNDLKDGKLTVEVKFGSDSHKITFSAGAGGSLTAKLKDGATLTNPQDVPEGAEVTFTAAPENSKGVQRWTVDGNPYYWPGTTDLYRETTLTLKNISDDRTVRVDFTEAEAATHAITANYITESGAAVTGLNITAKLASGTNADLTKVPDGAAVTFTVNGLTSNYTVKEWQVDGRAAAGSVGQTSFTLRNIITHHTVTAVIAVAAEHTLTFKVIDAANKEITDETIAKLTATSRGTAIQSGSPVAAYTPIDFSVALNESYYVTGWENAQANESDKSKATLNGWNADTLVKVFIAKKPVVKFTGDENKNITVTAKQGDKKLTSGDWVEMSSGDIIFTATPEKGWETADWNVIGWKQENNTANDNTTYTKSGPITGNVNIQVTAKEIPKYNLKLSVQDLGNNTYGGTVSANITRKQLEEYKDPITTTTSDSKNFYRDSDIKITATPAEGYCVQEWTIDGVTTPTRAKTWTLPNWQKNAEVKVRFVKEVSGITFAPVEESSVLGGYISAAVSNGESILSSAASGVNIAAGQPISFTATVQPGYEVEGWYVNDVRDNDAGKQRTYTYPNTTSESSIYIEPKFQQVEYNITTGDNVTVNDQTSTTARGGTSLTFRATPPTGQQLTGWTVNGEAVPGSGNTLTWTVENGYTTKPNVTAYRIEAQFSAGEYAVTYNGQPTGGTLKASVDSGKKVSGGTNVTFRATPNEGYEIDQWTVNNKPVSAGDTYTLNVTENSRVAVSFKQMMKVTASVNGQPGEITITAGGKTVTDGWVSSGTDVTFTVTPDHADDMVQVWTVGGTQVAEMSDTADAPLTWTVKNVTADTNVTATLVERPTYTITVTHGENGTVAAEQTSVKRGGSTTITATPKNTNYYLKKWVVDGSDQAASGKTLTLREIRKDTRVEAVFDEAISYNVTLDVQGATAGTTVTAKANGSAINPQKDSPANVVGGSELVFTAKPATNNEGNNTQMVAEWTVKGHPELTTIANVLKIPSLTSATEVTVKFAPYKGFAIPTDGSGYTVNVVNRTPSDTMPTNEIRENGTLKFTVTPTGKALFTELTVNNVNCLTEPKEGYVTAVKSGTSYTITIPKVTQEITLSATAAEYQLNSKELTEVPSELGNITMEQLKTTLRTHISSSVSTSNIAYLNVELQYRRGNEWVKVTDPSMFPDGGLDVTIPYSTLSTTTTLDSSYNYSVVHMFLTNMNNQTVGSTETLTATAGTKGITFHVNSLSPFAIGWYKNTPTPGGGGGGGGGAVSTYTLTFDTNGGSAIDKITKDSGTTIDLATYKPTRAGYTFAGWFSDKALTKAVTSVKLTANTTVYAKWTQNGGTAQNPFVDVKEGAYYYDAVLWAVEQKITSGTSATTFSPDASCTRAQMVTFLWRAAGSPKVENGKNPFTDVKADAYYYDAVLWAVEKGVTSGTSATTFSPDATVTRGQTVTFLYRNAGSPEVSGTMPFTDVEADAYYAKAVQWAVQQKITTGTSETTFSPMSDCTRGQIVTFLYRAK